MRKLIIGLLLISSSASAFDGNNRIDWIGKQASLAELPLANKPTIYVFVQPDCAGCSLQLGYLSAFQKSNPSSKITLVTEQNTASLKEYLSGFSLSYDIVTDLDGKIVNKLGIRTIPSTLYVNKNGIIEGFYEGTLNNTETRNLSTALISGSNLPKLFSQGGVGSAAKEVAGIDWTRSKKNVLIFHSSSCHYCQDELPHLIDFANKNPSTSFYIIAPDNIDEVKKQFSSASKNIKIIESATEGGNRRYYDDYKIRGTPTQILVNDKGVITWRGEGFSTSGNNPFDGSLLK